MLIFDAHLDLSMNAMEWNRDLRENVHTIREREQGQTDKTDRAQGTVAFPDMRRGQIGLCVATQIARYVKPSNNLQGWHSPEQAWAQTQGQLAWYRTMEEDGHLLQITDAESLNQQAAIWTDCPPEDAPIGYILSLEGADSIITPQRLERSYLQGLRAVGLSHYGPGTYAQGTAHTGGLGARGGELLKEMDRLGMILDATHLCDDSFWEAMDIFEGPVWASHNNCRALVPNDRQFSDDQIKCLIERGAVIGGALDAWMMVPDWQRGKTTPEESGVKLEHMIDHMDHICQLAGNADHIGIGTDLDGGYGREQSPGDLDTIADLGRLPSKLTQRGYNESDITGVMHGNFVGFLNNAWA
ncbi:MAG: membrane dipeptidase [Verrucomicrobiota bacterium]|jgi:membrane dipeptidase|nr:membrane dipeptidase [Verrucomicrobiota bacterium]